jgi:hypothetical protein
MCYWNATGGDQPKSPAASRRSPAPIAPLSLGHELTDALNAVLAMSNPADPQTRPDDPGKDTRARGSGTTGCEPSSIAETGK